VEHCEEIISSSLHDWFYYGREVFEDRREKLKRVAEIANVTHLCPSLDMSYDKRVNIWRSKYLGEELIEEEESVLEENCGNMFVETVDFLDHCIGTAYDPYFWWEHYVFHLTWIVMPCIWYGLVTNRIRFVWGFPTRGWIFFITMTGINIPLSQYFFWVVRLWLVTYYVPYCFRLHEVIDFLIAVMK
jgi:hypothetical protein